MRLFLSPRWSCSGATPTERIDHVPLQCLVSAPNIQPTALQTPLLRVFHIVGAVRVFRCAMGRRGCVGAQAKIWNLLEDQKQLEDALISGNPPFGVKR